MKLLHSPVPRPKDHIFLENGCWVIRSGPIDMKFLSISAVQGFYRQYGGYYGR
jgi:hypothetical protein